MCEDCREDWGDEIYNGVEAFIREWPDAEFGPAHIVLSDMNCEEGHIRWCLGLIAGELRRRGRTVAIEHIDEQRGANDLQSGRILKPDMYADSDEAELNATTAFLRDWLLPRTAAVESSDGR